MIEPTPNLDILNQHGMTAGRRSVELESVLACLACSWQTRPDDLPYGYQISVCRDLWASTVSRGLSKLVGLGLTTMNLEQPYPLDRPARKIVEPAPEVAVAIITALQPPEDCPLKKAI